MTPEKGETSQGNSPSSGFHTNWLILGIGSHKDGLNMFKDADNKGETSRSIDTGWLKLGIGSSKEDGLDMVMTADKEEIHDHQQAESSLYIPEDIMQEIFCRLPLHRVWDIQSLCSSWRKNFCSPGGYFLNLWDNFNRQKWLVMDHYDRNECSDGLALFDINRGLWLKQLFNDEWRFSNLKWHLRCGNGGFLLYSCKSAGILKIVNPLTMKFHNIPDARITRRRRLSCCIKREYDKVGIKLKFDSVTKSYKVVVIGNFVSRKLYVLIYRFPERSWEVRVPQHGENIHNHHRVCIKIKDFPRIFLRDQKIYCFSKNGRNMAFYDLNGDANSLFKVATRMECRTLPLEIVIYKGRFMMVCKVANTQSTNLFDPYNMIIICELDEVAFKWRSVHTSTIMAIDDIVRPKFAVTFCGGDCIWIIYTNSVFDSKMISIDVDVGKEEYLPGVPPLIFSVRNCLSMPLRFSPWFERS